MTENRTPIQISENRVLCEDKTLWELGRYGWVKLPPVPTDEQYEILKQDSAKKEMELMERELKKLRH